MRAADTQRGEDLRDLLGFRYALAVLPIATDDERIAFTDPDIRWTCASQLLRELHGCTPVNL